VSRRSWISSALLAAILATLGGAALMARLGPTATPSAAPAAAPVSQDSGITVEYRGWSHYKLTSPTGKIVLTNPFITNNPDAAVTVDEAIAQGADVIVVADGHPDELGDTVTIAKGTGARVVIPFEAGTVLVRRDGLPAAQVLLSGPGATQRIEGITINVLNSVHGSGMENAPAEPRLYGGPAVSYMITFENGFTVYFSGSSAATLDMGMWGDWYKPDAAILHQDASHNPRDAAMVGKLISTNNPNLKTVFPHHHRLQPQPGGLFRPADLRNAIQEAGVNVNFIEPNPLQPYQLTK
jgi:L-ascorbate metabolism protein UlaG (beta-lactamase superfamily)